MRLRALIALAALAASLLVGPTPHAAAEEPAHILLRIDSDDDDVSIDAELEWEDLEESAQFVVLRDALRSDDLALARAAARRLDPDTLDLAALHRQALVLSTVPGWVLGRNDGAHRFGRSFAALGAPELPTALRTFTLNARADAVPSGRALHRALDTSHIPALVDLLPSEDPVGFRTASWMLIELAQLTDEHRADVLRGVLYTLDRLAWERACEELEAGAEQPLAPMLRSLGEVALGPRPSPEFLELAAAVWTDDGALWEGRIDTDLYPPFHWFQRWAMDLRPTVDDLETLERIATSNPDERAFAWALHGIATTCEAPGLQGRGVVILGRVHESDGEFGVRWAASAAWMARLGERDEWNLIAIMKMRPDLLLEGEAFVLELEELGIEVPPDDNEYPLDDLLWIADPALAGAVTDVPDPTPREREHLRLEWGVEIGSADLALLEARRWAEPDGLPALIRFYESVAPERLVADRAEELARRMYEIPLRWIGNDTIAFDTEDGSVDLFPILARLEVTAPASLRALAKHWVTRRDAPARRLGFRVLALTGDAHDVEAMIASWKEGWDEHTWALGRIADPRVRDLLRERLGAAATWEDGREIAGALLVNSGLPPICVHGLRRNPVDREAAWDAEPLMTFRRLLVEGDGAAALLQLARETKDERLLPLLAFTRTDAARAYLQAARERPMDELYWSATLGLALTGDAPATAEIRSLFAENRTWMLGTLLQHWRAIASQPEWAHWQVDRITDNCCARFQAVELLRATYPTIPVADARESPIEQRAFVLDWLRAGQRRFRMQWSWIARGWLPVTR